MICLHAGAVAGVIESTMFNWVSDESVSEFALESSFSLLSMPSSIAFIASLQFIKRDIAGDGAQ